MRKILLMIPCMVLALLVLFPVKAEAFEYNGTEYATVTSFNYYMGYGTLDLHRHEIYSTNPDAKILVITSLFKRNDGTYGYPAWLVSVGGDTEITVFRNGTCVIEKQLVQEVNMDALNAGLLNNLGEGGGYHAETGIFALIGYMGFYDPTSGSPAPYVSDISGYMIEIPYDDSIGNPTWGHVKYAVENIETLKHQQEVYDSSLPVPDLVSFRDTKSSLIRVSNYNDYKVEYKIKLYGPSHIYFKSENLVNISFDISGEFPSSFYIYRLPDTSILRIGSNHGNNFSGYSHVYYDCMSDFKDFCRSCSDEVIFEYENAAVGALVGKFYYRDYISYANYDFYDYEIYARFLDDSGQDILYGDWTHLVIRRDGSSSSGSGGSGNDEPVEDEDNRNNEDLIPDIPDFSNFENFDASNLWDFISSLANSLGQVPTIVSQIFGFMPSWVLYMIGIGIAAIVILRFLGR